ncbi:MAG: DUF2442 domain-containing protein [Thermodesulfovibrionales bacterium]|nr:DUF2442 domain-containing protein [Thermodesulfovibrionales bacterium]MDP3112301.1 DUF2442 domain-containing protein [Thermodesulfovibrionales bacterium]
MDYIPHIIEANYVRDYVIKVKFDDGTVKILNLESYIKRGGVFSELKDKEYFKRFFIDLNTLCWPNGADIAPERLYEIGKEVSTKKSLVKV